MLETVGKAFGQRAKSGKKYIFITPYVPLVPGVPYNAFLHDNCEEDKEIYTITRNV